MSSFIKTIFLALLAIAVVVLILFIIWPHIGGDIISPDSTTLPVTLLLPDNVAFVNLGPLQTEPGEPRQWVVFFREKEGPYKDFVQGAVYRAQPIPGRLPAPLLVWRLGAGPAPIDLGEVMCRTEGRDVLDTDRQVDPTELVIWGYAAKQKSPTRMNLFYCPGLTGQLDISQLSYVHHRSFVGERGIFFRGDDPKTLVVQRIITWPASGDTLAQSALCRREQYTPLNGDYPPTPQKSCIHFASGTVPAEYPQYPEEVVVAFCLRYSDENARQKYVLPGAPVPIIGATGGGLGALSCMAAAPPAIEVLDLTRPTTQDGNNAQVYTRLQVSGEQGSRDVTWKLQLRRSGPEESAAWHWYIGGVSGP